MFLDFSLKRNKGKIFVFVYRKPTHTDQYLHNSSDHQTNVSIISFSFSIEHSIITNKDDITKENAKINQVLK